MNQKGRAEMAVSHVSPGLPIVVSILFGLTCTGFGIYYILKAIWILRLGENEALFVLRGMIGIALLILPWLFIWMAPMVFVFAPPQSGTP
jgi:hypothetical protein